eukprot:CAMPEP_0198678912 /NCGR_PEP_ID=MMETSP1468-20131203/1773_1 /TAXON_ID=1461545 /ORGANISM="Mantoniella sp, Strain CCMP1436" /LENGTH=1139 /DNA_ID=CAMNT_0044416927 /DNA_START=597 /DNA_END=4016 /DNA_ORIENTATION=+
MQSLQQTSGTSMGGTVIPIFGTFHAEKLFTMCRVGSIGPIATSQVSANGVECVSPAHMITVADISVGFRGDGYVLKTQEYVYTPACALQAIIPSKGSTEGELVVTLHQVNRGPQDVVCEALGSKPTFGSLGTHFTRCTMAVAVPGFAIWETIHNVVFDSEDTAFEYISPGRLISMFPNSGSSSGGTLITLTGVNFVNDGQRCDFDGRSAPGMMVSTVIFVCETPAFRGHLATSPVRISLVANAFVTTVLELSLIFPPTVESIFPRRGSSEGGTAIVIATQDKPAKNGFSIAVGTIRPVAFRFMNGDVLGYVSPAHSPGRAIVKLGVSLSDRGGAGVPFEHIILEQLCACSLNCAGTFGAVDALAQRGNVMNVGLVCMSGLQCADYEQEVEEDCSTYHNQHGQIGQSTGTMSTSGDTGQVHSIWATVTQQEEEPKVLNFFPPTTAATGGVVTVYGLGLTEQSLPHHGVSASQLVSSALMRMESSGGAPGEYFTPLVPASILRSQAVRLLYEVEARATSVQPAGGTMDGGTVMWIAGESFTDSIRLSCTVGTFTPVNGRWIDSHTMECISPAHDENVVAIGVTNGPSHPDRATVTFRYYATEILSSSSCMQRLGLVGAELCDASRTSRVSSGRQMSNASHRALALFDMPQMAQVLRSASVQDVGLVAAAVGGSRYDAQAEVMLQYITGPTVQSIIPMHVDSGTHHPVNIFGKEFSEATAFCLVGDKVLPALILSSALAICELPDYAEGDVSVAVGRQLESSNVGVVTYFRQTRVVEVAPSSGPDTGGTLVVVKTLSERQSPSQCRFGTTGPVAARMASTAAHQCTSPSRRACTIPLSLSIVTSGIGSYAMFSLLSSSSHLGVSTLRTSQVQTCSPLDVGTDHTLGITNALFYNDESKTLCTSHSAGSGFMVISLEPNSTPPTWMSFHFLSFAHTQAVFAISSLVPHTSVQLTNLDVAVVHAPHVRSLHPALGFVGGGTLTRVVGADMVVNEWSHLNCRFGNESQQAHTISSALSCCEVPAGMHSMNGFVAVELSQELPLSAVGVEEAAVQYVYVDSPSLEHIVPARGPSRGGTALHVHGSRFSNTQDLSCKFGNMHVRATYVSEQEILCLTPSHTHGGVALHVATNGRDYTMNPLLFSFLT